MVTPKKAARPAHMPMREQYRSMRGLTGRIFWKMKATVLAHRHSSGASGPSEPPAVTLSSEHTSMLGACTVSMHDQHACALQGRAGALMWTQPGGGWLPRMVWWVGQHVLDGAVCMEAMRAFPCMQEACGKLGRQVP